MPHGKAVANPSRQPVVTRPCEHPAQWTLLGRIGEQPIDGTVLEIERQHVAEVDQPFGGA